MDCPDAEVLAELLATNVSNMERDELAVHVARCSACRSAVELVFAEGSNDAPEVAAAAEAGEYGRYQILERIGAGGMGVVYRARDPELDRIVALKVLRSGTGGERIKREAQALAKLIHPNVVTVFDVSTQDESFIAMQYVDGANLRQWLREPRPRAEVLRVLRDAGHGVVAAHAVGLIHRDLKPDNVFISHAGQVLVGDFGLVREARGEGAPDRVEADVSDALDATRGTVLGTPAYMAPEQAHDGTTSTASDQFSFCVMAWEALVGARPFAGSTLEEIADNARAARLVEPPKDRALQPRLDRALRRGLHSDPAERFASMEDLLHELAPRRTRLGLALSAVGIAGLGAAVAFAAIPHSDEPELLPCGGEQRMLDDAWGATKRAELVKRAGTIPKVGVRVLDVLDKAAADWISDRGAVCKAQGKNGRAYFEHRIGCFDRFHRRLAATSRQLLEHPDRLGDLDTMRFVEVALPVKRCAREYVVDLPPPSASQRADVLAAEEALVVQQLTADPTSVRKQADELLARADAIGYLGLKAEVARWNATLAIAAGDYAGAAVPTRKALQIADAMGDDISRAELSAALATIFANQRDFAGAAQQLEAAKNALARTHADPWAEVAVLDAQATLDRLKNDRNHVASEEKLVERVRAVYGPGATLADALAGLAFAYGDDRRAKALLDEMTSIVGGAGDVEAAVAELLAQLEEAERRNDLPAMLDLERRIALTYESDGGDVQGAFFSWKMYVGHLGIGGRTADIPAACAKAVAHYERGKMKDPAALLDLLQDCAIAELELGHPDTASQIMSRAAQSVDDSVDASTADGVRVLQGRVAVAQGHLDEAIAILAPLLPKTRNTPRTTRLAHITWNLALAYYDVGGKRALAIERAREADEALGKSIDQYDDNPLMVNVVVGFKRWRGDIQTWLANARP